MVAAGADTMGHMVNGKQIEGTGVPGDVILSHYPKTLPLFVSWREKLVCL